MFLVDTTWVHVRYHGNFNKKTNTRISKMALDWPMSSLVTFKYSLTLYCPHFHIFAWWLFGRGVWVNGYCLWDWLQVVENPEPMGLINLATTKRMIQIIQWMSSKFCSFQISKIPHHFQRNKTQLVDDDYTTSLPPNWLHKHNVTKGKKLRTYMKF